MRARCCSSAPRNNAPPLMAQEKQGKSQKSPLDIHGSFRNVDRHAKSPPASLAAPTPEPVISGAVTSGGGHRGPCPVQAELSDKELIFRGFTPYTRDYEIVVYEPVDPNPNTVLSRDTSVASLGTGPRPPSPPGPGLTYRPGPSATTPSGCGTSPGTRPATSGGGVPGGLPRCHRHPRLQASGVLGQPARGRVPRGPGRGHSRTIGLVFSDSCRGHPPVMRPSLLRPGATPNTPRASMCREDSRPLTRTGHPMGHARARDQVPRSAPARGAAAYTSLTVCTGA